MGAVWSLVPLAPLLYMGGGAVLGVTLVLLVQYWLLSKWWKTLEVTKIGDPPFSKPHPHPALQDFLEKTPRPLSSWQRDELPNESCFFLNMVISFLFQELRDTINVRRFFLRMLEKDMKLLRETSNLGSVLKKTAVADLNFGTSMPCFSDVALLRPKTGNLGNSQELDLTAQISYGGNFRVKMDCDLVFGRKAMVAVTVVELRGKLKVSFRHFPHQHWSASFVEEPVLRLDVQSTFQGRAVPQVNALIANQIRRSIRKKHTLPAAKMRYPPFYKPPTDYNDPALNLYGLPLHVGSLNVRILCVSDFTGTKNGTHSFCALSLENEDVEDDTRPDEVETFDVEVLKAGKGGSVGLQFQAPARNMKDCRIETIQAGSPASGTVLQPGDQIIAVSGAKAGGPKNVIRLIKQADAKVTLTVQRDSAASQREGQEVDNSGSLMTKPSQGKKDILFDEEFLLDVTLRHRYLYVRVCDCRLTSNGRRTGKQYLMGFTEVNLPEAAFYCVATQKPHRQKYPLRANYSPAAPIIGQLELALEFEPNTEMAADETPAQAEGGSFDGEALSPASRLSTASSVRTPDAISRASSVSHLTDDIAEEEDGSEVGQELFAELPLEDRRRELEEMTERVRAQIDLEEETRADLERQLEDSPTASNRQRLNANINASDERKALLYQRMLKCVSALQNCEETLALGHHSVGD